MASRLRTVANVTRCGMWAVRASLTVRPRLRRHGAAGVILPPAPPIAGSGPERAVEAVCRIMRLSCLESALVRQAWAGGHGEDRRLVLGVTSPSGPFEAHAWLEGDRVDDRFTALPDRDAPDGA